MDLDDATAAEVLDDGVVSPNGKQVYGYRIGRLYEFQPDNVGTFHGYPIPGNQAPPAVLRELLAAGKITRAEYRGLIRSRQ